tara:strand:+ start:366 stop:596 length:231 start_codon:yes stop_codon:yes gene_type:complete
MTDLTPMYNLHVGDVFYIKRRGKSKFCGGPYTYKDGMRAEEGSLLMKCRIRTECGIVFYYRHMLHGAEGYVYEFYK